MMIIAFFIGAAALNAAQNYWMSAMMDRIDNVSSSRKDWLPSAAPVTVDTSQMDRWLYTPGVIPATRP